MGEADEIEREVRIRLAVPANHTRHHRRRCGSRAQFGAAPSAAFEPQDALPQDRRRRSLPRLPLIDDRVAGGGDAPSQAGLRESKPPTQRTQ